MDGRIGMVLLLLAPGCTIDEAPGAEWPAPPFRGPDAGLDARPVPDAAPVPDASIFPVREKIYAHSASTLFEIDPGDLSVTTVGNFGWPPGIGADQMTDLAVDDLGRLTGISYSRLYGVDPDTADCTYLAELAPGGGFNGLSYIEGVGDDPEVPTLVAAAVDGRLFAIDEVTGDWTLFGDYGGSYHSSGDLVYVRGTGGFATVTGVSMTDLLVSFDPATGAAQWIGETGFYSIWGLAYWEGLLYGFTAQGEFLLIDTGTGESVLVEQTLHEYWGAGVTTIAR